MPIINEVHRNAGSPCSLMRSHWIDFDEIFEKCSSLVGIFRSSPRSALQPELHNSVFDPTFFFIYCSLNKNLNPLRSGLTNIIAMNPDGPTNCA